MIGLQFQPGRRRSRLLRRDSLTLFDPGCWHEDVIDVKGFLSCRLYIKKVCCTFIEAGFWMLRMISADQAAFFETWLTIDAMMLVR